MLLLSALVAGSSSVWATDVVYKEQQFSSSTFSAGVSSYTGTFDNTYNGFKCNYSNFNNNNKGWNLVKCGGKGGAYTGVITTDAAIDKAIKKVTLTIDEITSANVTSITLYSSDSKSSGWASLGTFTKSTGAQDVTISSPAANKYYKIEAVCTKHSSKNGLLVISKIQFYIENIAITSISLPSTETVGVGGTVTLTPTVLPAGYTETPVWESTNTSVATVSNGVVTGVSAGEATIRLKSPTDATIKAECAVTVTAPVAVTGVTLKSSTTIEVGKTETLNATILPADATNKIVYWESSDDSKVSVDDDGVITGLALTGETPVVITVLTDDGDFEAECEVTVIPKNTDVNLTSPISITDWESLSYGAAAEYEVGGVYFTATQCMNNAGLQFKKSEGILASPLIKSTYGYTVIVTTNTTGTGTLTLQIGSETPVSISSGSSTTYSATTSNTSVAFTLTNSSSKACNIASLSIVPYVPVTVTSDGYATLASSFALDFTDAATYAYIAKADGRTGVTFERIKKVPANTGVLLYKDGGTTENIPVLDGEADATTGNVFVPGTGAAVASVSGDLHNYILNKPTAKPIGFYQAAGQTVAANKAYIQIDYSVVAGIKEFIALPGFEDDATSIQNSKFEIQNEEAPIYNLAGQRISKMQKGINIVNGKKVLF